MGLCGHKRILVFCSIVKKVVILSVDTLIRKYGIRAQKYLVQIAESIRDLWNEKTGRMPRLDYASDGKEDDQAVSEERLSARLEEIKVKLQSDLREMLNDSNIFLCASMRSSPGGSKRTHTADFSILSYLLSPSLW